MSSLNACETSVVSPHCGRAKATPMPATASTNSRFLITRLTVLCERNKLTSSSGAANKRDLLFSRPRGISMQQHQRHGREHGQPEPGRLSKMRMSKVHCCIKLRHAPVTGV